MLDPLPISEVEIVGYANKLTESMLPAVVPPIFRSKEDPSLFFLPPYMLQEGYVWNALKRDEKELRQLVENGEVTLFEETSFEAKPDYELWIDSENPPHYEPIPDATAELRAIAEQCISDAVEALKAGNYIKAKELTRKAMCADDRFIEPLAIRAAIARKENEPGQMALMSKLACTRSTKDGFDRMAADYYAEILATLTASVRPAGDLFMCHPMHDIALKRAA